VNPKFLKIEPNGNASVNSRFNHVSSAPRKKAHLIVVGCLALAMLAALLSDSTTSPGGEFHESSADAASVSSNPVDQVCTPPGHAVEDSAVADSSAPHGLYVLSGTRPLAQADLGRQIQKYLVHNPDVCGGAVFVFWSEVDNGPGVKDRYDWTYVNQLIAPWAKAHKTVALLLGGASGYSSNGHPGGVPHWLAPQLHTVSCGRAQAPIYWRSAYESKWQKFVAAFIHHYEHNPNVAYIHVGLATGSQTLVLGAKGNPDCLAKWNAVGYQADFPQYVYQMISFVTALHASVQLNVSLNAFADYPPSGQIAARDVAGGIGFGFNGLQASDVTATTNHQECTADWCALFNQYAGKVPLYVQTLFSSDPGTSVSGSSSTSTGPLPPLLSTALGMHAQIFELYAQDWLLAFDPSYQGYAEYHAAMARALAATATVVGTANGVAPVSS
jgi:hypothetical protein